MLDLGEYFSYNNDISSVSNVFENLSRHMKEIHNQNMIVPNLSSKTISCDNGFHFISTEESYNFEAQKRENMVSFAKLFIGTYLSLGTGFKDFSFVDDEWFTNNLGDITSTITAEDFYPEYFENLFVNGYNEYYSDFMDRKRQDSALNNRSNVNGYSKVLRTAASSLYSDEEEVPEGQLKDEQYPKNAASINQLFYPLIIGGTLLITLLILMIVKLNH